MAAPSPLPALDDLTPEALIAARPFLKRHAQSGLMLEEVPLNAIADALGTPTWVYSAGTMRKRLAELTAALSGLDAHIHFAVKSNDHLAVLRLMAQGGAGADVVSGGELLRARHAGIAASNIVFSGVGKTADEIRLALSEGIYQLNVESAEELEMISAIASNMGKTADIVLRINPDVDAGTHAKITTGLADNKFGIQYQDAAALYAHAASLPGISPQGLALHIGSQILSMAPFRAAYARAAQLIRTLRASGHSVTRMDCGGGLGILYADEAEASPAAFAGVLRQEFGNMGLTLMTEPGRWLVGNAGLLLSSVILTKADGRFTVLDAAMNDLVRPAMYDAFHAIVPVGPGNNGPLHETDIVGPVCETGDTFARHRPMPSLNSADRVAILEAGAYGAVMSSTYNSRPLAAIAMVDGANWATIRARQSVESLWSGELIPEFLG